MRPHSRKADRSRAAPTATIATPATHRWLPLRTVLGPVSLIEFNHACRSVVEATISCGLAFRYPGCDSCSATWGDLSVVRKGAHAGGRTDGSMFNAVAD